MSPEDAHCSPTVSSMWEIYEENWHCASSGDIIAHHIIISESSPFEIAKIIIGCNYVRFNFWGTNTLYLGSSVAHSSYIGRAIRRVAYFKHPRLTGILQGFTSVIILYGLSK